jgi:hypothetical protein
MKTARFAATLIVACALAACSPDKPAPKPVAATGAAPAPAPAPTPPPASDSYMPGANIGAAPEAVKKDDAKK